MKTDENTHKFIALLRGINVGGHHKVPMKHLKQALEEMGLQKVETLLNSGNAIFETGHISTEQLEEQMEKQLETTFGFSIPVIVTTAATWRDLYNRNPFKTVNMTRSTRLYVSFLKNAPVQEPELPWTSEDKSFSILSREGKIVCSVLDISGSKSTEAMKTLENFFGKDITTRNFNTVERIYKKL